MAVDVAKTNAVATLTFDAGRLNILNLPTVTAVLEAIRDVENDDAVRSLVIHGRSDALTAGLDLSTIDGKNDEGLRLLQTMGHILVALLTSKKRTIVATAGHAVGAGAMMLLTANYRLGADGTYKIGFPEITNGMPLPSVPIELARARLSPKWFERYALLGQLTGPEDALKAGFLDETCPLADLKKVANERAIELAKITPAAYDTTHQRVRGDLIALIAKEFAAPR